MNMNMFISSLQNHGIPENPIPGRLYDSLQAHGFPVNPVPGVLYDSLQDHGFPVLIYLIKAIKYMIIIMKY